jgi:hypothetical protein
MDTKISAPLLSRVKSWQLVGLGLSGWCTLYSVAVITWGASSTVIGHAQGGCFAATMALASFETKRYKKGLPKPAGTLDWISGIPTDHLNQTLAQVMQKREFRVEPGPATDAEMGFGVRAVNAGRTMVFETSRWQEPVIDLAHALSTEENRKKALADLAVIVSVGKPDDDARTFAQSRPVRFLIGKEFKSLFTAEKPATKKG